MEIIHCQKGLSVFLQDTELFPWFSSIRVPPSLESLMPEHCREVYEAASAEISI